MRSLRSDCLLFSNPKSCNNISEELIIMLHEFKYVLLYADISNYFILLSCASLPNNLQLLFKGKVCFSIQTY